MKRAIAKIIKILGPDILLNTDCFFIALEDLKPTSISEIKILKEAYTKPFAQLLYDAYTQNIKINEGTIGKQLEAICESEKNHYENLYKCLYKDIYGTVPPDVPAYRKNQSNTVISSTAIRKIVDNISKKEINETFFLGRYMQVVKGSETPIEWIVVKKDSKKVLAISKYALLVKPYNNDWVSTSWQKSSIRQYLNEVFVKEAFSDVEISVLCDSQVIADKNSRYESVKQGGNTSDKVFLLSINEVDEILGENRICKPTQVITDKIQTGEDGTCRWWLRTLGYDTDCATGVYADGKIDRAGFSVNSEDAVRPAICIRIG